MVAIAVVVTDVVIITYIPSPFIFISESWAPDHNVQLFSAHFLSDDPSALQINPSKINFNIVSAKLFFLFCQIDDYIHNTIVAAIKTPISLISNIQPLPASIHLPLKSLWNFSLTPFILITRTLVQAFIFHMDYGNDQFIFCLHSPNSLVLIL